MDTIISSGSGGVIKLEGPRNWVVWKFQITVLLKGLGIYKIVDGTEQKPTTGAAEWISKDGKAQSLIVTRLTENTMTHIVTCETAADMWKKLLSIFEQKSESSIHLVQQRFFSYKYEEGMEISVFLSKVQELARQLKDLGEQISDKFVMTKIVMSLPEKFKYFIPAWESVAEENKTIDNLIARLLSEEERMMKIEDSVALISKENKSKIKCYKCNQYGHVKKDCKEKESKEDRKCFYCKKTGHTFKFCKYRIEKEKKDTNQNKSNAFIVTAAAMFGGSSSDKWFVDSGATEHICYMKNLFTEYKALAEEKVVIIGDGTRHNAVGIGKIKLEAFDGYSWIVTTLENVLFVPSMVINLFSVRCATDKGYVMMIDKEKCQFIKNNEIGAIAIRSGKLYEMKFRYSINQKDDVLANVGYSTLTDWHEKLAHQNIEQVKKILERNNIKITAGDESTCIACLKGKQHRISFGKSDFKKTKVCELIHIDVCGPMENNSIGNSRYFLLIKDDWSNYRTVYFMKNKFEAVEKLKVFIKLAENETGNKIKIIRSDNGTEFTNKEAKKLFEENGIRHQTTVSYTPEQNAKAEREMRTLVEAARTMIQAKGMEKMFWAEAVNTAAYVMNRTGKSKVENKTPYEVWSGRQFDISNLKIFGSEVFVHTPKQKRLKWDAKSEKGIFVGYGENTKGYRIYFRDKRTIEIKKDVKFTKQNFEEPLIIQEQTNLDITGEPEVQQVEEFKQTEEIECQEEVVNSGSSDVSNNEQFFSDVEEEQETVVEENKLKKRAKKTPNWMNDYVTSFISIDDAPKTYAEAMARDDSEKWSEAVEKELEVMKKNKVWIEVSLPKNKVPISSKWVFKIKPSVNGDVNYKARLVARGFEQKDNLDESEIYSPVAKLTTVRVFVVIATKLKLPIYQMDVRGAFLYGDIDEEVYMLLPDGVQCEKKVVKLQKSINGLKKSPKYWNEKFNEVITKEGFVKSKNDYCLYVMVRGKINLYLLLYVDDLLIFGNVDTEVSRVKSILNSNFEMKDLGLVSDFLGINIKQNIDQGISLIKQNNYLKKILVKFNMIDCKEMSTPMDQKFKFDLLINDKKDKILENKCRQLIGSLIYAVSGSRPDLCASVSFLSRYQEYGSVQLFKALKRILRYIKATLDYNLVYKCIENDFIVGYVDADWGGDCYDRKSTSGYCFKVFGCTVSWSCKKQACVTLSSTEAEYVALSLAMSEACWLKNLLSDFKLPNVVNKPVIIYEDNQSAIRVAKNPEHHKRLKHIDIKYHFIREKIAEGVIEVKYIQSSNQIADIFTKPLGKELFQKFRKECGLEL